MTKNSLPEHKNIFIAKLTCNVTTDKLVLDKWGDESVTRDGEKAHFKIGGVIGNNGGNHNHYANQKKWFVNHKNPIILMRDCDLIGKMRLDANVCKLVIMFS